MDTMELNKIVLAVCGAFLIYLLVNWVGESVYHVEAGGHGYGDEEVKMGYLIEVEDTGSDEPEEEGPSLEELLAVADIGKGENVFKKCATCHALEAGKNGTGPHLVGVVDRGVAQVDGFGYSNALASLGGQWTTDALNGFLENPKSYARGTTMGFAGLKKDTDRANLIAYLQTVQ